MPQRGYPRGRWTVPASVVCVLFLVMAGASPVRAADQRTDQAAPAAAAARTSPALAELLAELAAGSYEVTLLTGDEVRLDVHAGGRFGVDVTPAPRPDGSTPSVEWYTEDGGLYVVPADAAAHLDSGLLDRQLFDVAYLAANGYADGDAAALPVIVEYAAQVPAGAVASRSGNLAAGTRTATLESLNAAGVSIDKARASSFWTSLASTQPASWRPAPAAAPPAGAAAPPAGVEKVWLDRKVEVTLDESVPQIGAPQAWGAGYDGTGVTVAVLDSGIDATHPDLAGKVAASRSFIEGEDVVDGHGHGTHVASTVAGTGEASGGRYRGVAPGAELVIGKVLDDTGSGAASGVIEGMEWATVTQGADVVNMSIGSRPSDGNDPISQAVNNLTATTGALFVISAGNDGAGDAPPGAGDYTINAPGAATAALTVGAVDKSDRLAFFSSRGPRPGDSALKPEITAPGRAIVAARAAGTSMGTPVDDFYTAEDGTSMSTPHVAGAAAILKQQHPDWGADDVKAALVATAADVTGDRTVYQRGAGRLDVGRAVRQQVRVSPALADFGYRPFDDRGDPVTKTFTYSNPTDRDVTLDLDTELTTVPDFPVPGDPVPEGTLTLAAETLTVPANGTASLAVTLDPGELETELYSGSLLASNDDQDIRLTTPIGLSIGEIRHKITITLVDRTCDNGVFCPKGISSFEWGVRSFIPVERFLAGQGVRGAGAGPPAHLTSAEPGQAEGSRQLVGYVEPGAYMLLQRANWVDADTREPVAALLWAPEIVIDGTASATIDANDAQIYAFELPQPATRISVATEFARLGAPTGQSSVGGLIGGRLHASNPTQDVTVGTFVTSHQEVLTGPPPGTAATDSDERPYAYFLKPHEIGRIPESLTYRFTHDELAIIDAHYHRADVGPLRHTGAVYHPLGPLGATRYLHELSGPVSQTEYWGPVSANLIRLRRIVDPAAGGAWREAESYAVFDQAARTTQHWNQPPMVPGATLGGSEVAAAFEFRTEVCAGCRQNDTFFPAQPHTFFPTMEMATLRHGDRGWRATFDALSAAGDVRLEHNGQEIPVSLFVGLVPSFALPAETGRFRLTLDVAAPPERIGPAEGFTPSRTAWEFTSGPVTGDRIPDGYVCMGNALFFGSGGDCRPDPLIFLRYDLGLDLANRAAAPGAHRFEVTTYRQPSLVAAPEIAGLRLWTSDDGGEDWTEARVLPLGDGRFRVIAVYGPPQRRASDTISIRTEAWDAAGNRVEQTVLDAYRLTDRRPTHEAWDAAGNRIEQEITRGWRIPPR